jgi:hypothetical protein
MLFRKRRLFDRADDTISLCEIKFNAEPFSIDKTYAKILQRKLDVFQTQTQTRKALQLVLLRSMISSRVFSPRISLMSP